MSDGNRFKDVINAARQQQPQQDERPIASSAPQPQRPEPARRGRPPGGKRNNPDYEQVAAYIPKDVYKRVRMRLLEMDKPREFSDLVEFLLRKWLQGNDR